MILGKSLASEGSEGGKEEEEEEGRMGEEGTFHRENTSVENRRERFAGRRLQADVQ